MPHIDPWGEYNEHSTLEDVHRERERAAKELAEVMIDWFGRNSYGGSFVVPEGTRVEILARAFQIMSEKLGSKVDGYTVRPVVPLQLNFFRY